jgi:hypothetical protein
MVSWYWIIGAGCFGIGLGLFAAGLCNMASDRRHERRMQTEIAGRSYWNTGRASE